MMTSWKNHLVLGEGEITQKGFTKNGNRMTQRIFEGFNQGFNYTSGDLEIKTKEILTKIPGNLVDAKCNDTLPRFDAIPSEFATAPS